MTSFVEELHWRGLLHQTAGDGLDEFLATPGRVAYCGFDPTSDSLHVGNFVQIKLLMHWQRAGHRPIFLMGGGTGLIGDPSGRDDERSLLTEEQVAANVASQRRILERLVDFEGSRGALVVNNHDWLKDLRYIEVLRTVGKHFSINAMVQKESVARRLERPDQGISYTEFSYMVLQAYDFLHLRRAHDCRAQLGGSDQYGNIVGGMDLIRREFGAAGGPVFGITSQLVSRSDGKKMSKSTGGALWLSADTQDATSVYAFYQYWINLPDADVEQWLKWFTLLDEQRIQGIVDEHTRAPHLRGAQRELAREMTRMVHGAEMLTRVEAASRALFDGEVRALDESMLAEVIADVPTSEHERLLLAGAGVSLVDLLPETSLAKSKREAREFLGSGAVSVNGERVDAERTPTDKDLLHGRTILVRRGKKAWHATAWR